MTSGTVTTSHPASSPGRAGQADSQQRRARRWFYSLLVPVFLKILWLHWSCSQGRQFARLGRRQARPVAPLPESWARWAAYRVARIIKGIPIIRRRECYWRSQLIYDVLPRFGFAMELHLGASLEDDKTTTHLWVSTRDVVLGDDADCAERYIELTAYETEAYRD